MLRKHIIGGFGVGKRGCRRFGKMTFKNLVILGQARLGKLPELFILPSLILEDLSRVNRVGRQ